MSTCFAPAVVSRHFATYCRRDGVVLLLPPLPSALRQTYNLVAIGAGTGGLVSAAGSAGVYAKVRCRGVAISAVIGMISCPSSTAFANCPHPASCIQFIQGCVVGRFASTANHDRSKDYAFAAKSLRQ